MGPLPEECCKGTMRRFGFRVPSNATCGYGIYKIVWI